MSEFLFDKLKDEFGKKGIEKQEFYKFISENLNPKFKLRKYQIEAFKRFFLYYENSATEYVKTNHICFNMATGSGKTLIMAGLILYLYQKGYRNFLFFVNRSQIVEKTKDNFINKSSSKFLFNQKIKFDSKIIKINSVTNFECVNDDDINICFTTVQGLFSDINNQKENSLTLDDFKDKKIVLIADEAHHINAATKNSLFDKTPSWENTVDKIYKSNSKNLLLEFSATVELNNKFIKDKYKDKILYKYDLKEFVKEKYSKNIFLFKSDVSMEDRILQALIVSVYREKIALKHGVNLKPVILFKAKKTIAESKENQEKFHNLIENLDKNTLESFKKRNKIEILEKIFNFFNENDINLSHLVEILKAEFSPKKCLCTNNDKELEENQKILNSLEDENNPIRAIFTVDRLNEGWDVLNLFDIVRLYDGQTSGGNSNAKLGKTTISEAQLIGRGARYFPFNYGENEKFRRKFDSDIENELRILEELFYYSQSESRYISEIRKALNDVGLMQKDEPKLFKAKLKQEFNKIEFLNKLVYKNHKIKKSYKNAKLSDFTLAKSNFIYDIKSGKGELESAFDTKETNQTAMKYKSVNLVKFCGENILKNAILHDEYFTIRNLKKVLPNLKSMSEFIQSSEYLGQFSININDEFIDKKDRLLVGIKFLTILKSQIQSSTFEFEGSLEFESISFKDIFKEKTIQINSSKEFKEIGMRDDQWYVFDSFCGTSEEINFISFIRNSMDKIKHKYKNDEIYLVRNERNLAIYDFKDGARFEPDFVLFLKDHNFSYQIFIEPKGKGWREKDEWKEEFLKTIKDKFIIDDENFRLIGLKFYTKEIENEFEEEFRNELSI